MVVNLKVNVNMMEVNMEVNVEVVVVAVVKKLRSYSNLPIPHAMHN